MPDRDDAFFGIDEFDDPIDLIETLADHNGWDFDRLDQDQIAMTIEGQWRAYSITLAWSSFDGSLRLVCTYDMQPPEEKMSSLYDALNLVNNQCWHGAFTYWSQNQLMVWRYALALQGCESAEASQVKYMIEQAVVACERFYPCFQLVCWGDQTPEDAVDAGIAEAYGRA